MVISPLDFLLTYEVKTLEQHRSNNSLSSAALFERSNKPQISSLDEEPGLSQTRETLLSRLQGLWSSITRRHGKDRQEVTQDAHEIAKSLQRYRASVGTMAPLPNPNPTPTYPEGGASWWRRKSRRDRMQGGIVHWGGSIPSPSPRE